MNKIYFERVPVIDSLQLEKILFSYENIPILFIWVDKNNIRYLCLCDDLIDEESWIIVPIPTDTLLDVLNNKITVLSAFKDRKIIIANRGFDEDVKYSIEEYKKIDPDELPLSDQYLEMKEYLSDYIDEIS